MGLLLFSLLRIVFVNSFHFWQAPYFFHDSTYINEFSMYIRIMFSTFISIY